MRRTRVCIIVGCSALSLLAGFLVAGVGAAEPCEEWVARIASVQGLVDVQRSGETDWTPVRLNDTLCPNDMIRVGEGSRAAVLLTNEIVLRLAGHSTVTFSGMDEERTLLLDLLRGAAHFFSRIPRGLKVTTPFVNGTVEGTEFYVRVDAEETFVSVFQGRVAASNEFGGLVLTTGQSAAAPAGGPPVPRAVVRPRDAVQWALYYPPVLDYRPVDFSEGDETSWHAAVRRSLEAYWAGDLTAAFARLDAAPEEVTDPRFHTYRAALLLTTGQFEGAMSSVEQALALDPGSSDALAVQAVVAVAQNRQDEALGLAKKAAELDPESSAARVALSYAYQARFDLDAAQESLEEAVDLDPENALAWARLAEVRLSLGYLKEALEAARKAAGRNPHLAPTQTILGFAYLAQVKVELAEEAFARAIELDQAAPLPRLGLGLAKIHRGKLKAGRTEIETAAILDPNNALIRSYLGKAYYEEKRDALSAGQYALAKELDPKDPTAWFYDAIRKQTVNRPVEALRDMQTSMELNENRAVYRSRLLLDQDLAARSAGLARIYRDLNFPMLALVEGWKSVNTGPDNFSAHRLLADLYSTQPRHKVARVSELLQSQLLQPINITPLQPQLAESNLFILSGAGPSNPSFNEFNPLFNRNRVALQANGIAGQNDTLGDDLVLSGVYGKVSASLGQFYYQTDGFRENNDLNQRIFNAFIQGEVTYNTSLQAEFRSLDRTYGDMNLYFDPDVHLFDLRNEDENLSVRIGLRHSFAPNSALIASGIFSDGESTNVSEEAIGLRIKGEGKGYMGEVQQHFYWKRIRLIAGGGYVQQDMDATVEDLWFGGQSAEEDDVRQGNVYAYVPITYPGNVTWTLGLSADFFRSDFREDEDQVNPKFGVTWNPFPSTTVRAAVFRMFQKTLPSEQTIEPTQVAGFNQLFDDPAATRSWRYGVAIDQKFSRSWFGGVEFSKRDLEVPFEEVPPPPEPPPPEPTALETRLLHTDWDEYLGRAYLYWTPHPWVAASAEFQYDEFKGEEKFGSPLNALELRTFWVSPGVSFFHPTGLGARLVANWVDQEGEFGDPVSGYEKDGHQFWVLDASIAYRLPRRFGIVTVEGKNLLNETFRFQDIDPANPRIAPERFIFGRISLSF